MKDPRKRRLSVLGIAARTAVILSLMTLNPFGSFPPTVGAHDNDDNRRSQRDHSLFFTGSTPADKAIYCGVRKGEGGYTLHISGTADTGPGSFIITFRDGDSMGFLVPQGVTVSTTHDLGGVPGVDDTVRITQTGGVRSMMVSVLADRGAKDPFDETLDGAPKERDNFCTRLDVNGGGEPGRTSAQLLVPAPF